MSKLKRVVFLFLLSITIYSQEVLTNRPIIELVELEFDSDLIISKIRTSNPKFDTSLKELKILKKNNVPSNVLALMMSKYKTKTKTGIYFYPKEGELKNLEPTVFSGTSSKSLLSCVTYGIWKLETNNRQPIRNCLSLETSRKADCKILE